MAISKKPARANKTRDVISKKPAGVKKAEEVISKKPANAKKRMKKAGAEEAEFAGEVQKEIDILIQTSLEQYDMQVKKIGENLWPGIVKEITQAMDHSKATENGSYTKLTPEAFTYVKKQEELLNFNVIQKVALKEFISISPYTLETEDSN